MSIRQFRPYKAVPVVRFLCIAFHAEGLFVPGACRSRSSGPGPWESFSQGPQDCLDTKAGFIRVQNWSGHSVGQDERCQRTSLHLNAVIHAPAGCSLLVWSEEWPFRKPSRWKQNAQLQSVWARSSICNSVASVRPRAGLCIRRGLRL